jgi:CheY-like chemotaxis protein
MPGMSGAEVARRVRMRHPKLPILFVTGYADRALLSGISEAQTIGKPFGSHDLAEKIAVALNRRSSGVIAHSGEGSSRAAVNGSRPFS